MKLQSKIISQKLLKSYLILISVQKATGLFWGVFETGKNVPCIPPIFQENKFITDFREKAELLNSLFTNQCSLIKNICVLPTSCENLTDKSFSNITITENDIGKIIKGLNHNKAHGHDMINICMLKL